jgi:hypothetical protein
MAVTGTRIATVRITQELEREVREKTKLPYLPLSSLARVAMATLAGYPLEEALDRFYIDPGSKRAQRLAAEIDTDGAGNA